MCLAQAQEVFWQKGVMSERRAPRTWALSTAHAFVPFKDRLKNGTIAKLAAQVAEFYGQASARAAEAKGAGGVWPAFSFPEVRPSLAVCDYELTRLPSYQALVSHLMIKNLHFAAVAQYRKSVDDLGANR